MLTDSAPQERINIPQGEDDPNLAAGPVEPDVVPETPDDAEDVAAMPVFRDSQSGELVPGQVKETDPESYFVGNVLTLVKEGAKRHYRITAISPESERTDEGTVPVVYLTPAKSQIAKSLMLLAILGVLWFVVEYAVGTVSSLIGG